MLTLLYTNDLHGCVGLLPRLAALITRERAHDPEALLLDAGDIGFGGLTSDLSARLLATFRYDALTPGNAENDLLDCRQQLASIGAPVLAANIAADAFGCPVVPALTRRVRGLRVALLGLTTPSPYPPGHPARQRATQAVPIEDPLATARAWAPRLRAGAELLVVISHLGLWADIELARTVPGIDLIIGGHSHHQLREPLRVGTTAITQAGVGGGHLGVITVTGPSGAFRITGRLAPVWEKIEDDPALTAMIAAYLRERRPSALEVVGETDGCWADPWAENPWANFVTDSLRAATGADLALYNASAIRPALHPGPLTVWDLERCVPGMPMNESMTIDEVVTVTLTGAAARAVCEHSVAHLPHDLWPGAPGSVRWPGNNLLHGSGWRVTFDLSRPLGQRVVALEIDGAPARNDRRYRVAMCGFLARGYAGYHWLRDAAERRPHVAERTLLLDALRRCRALPARDGRLRLESASVSIHA